MGPPRGPPGGGGAVTTAGRFFNQFSIPGGSPAQSVLGAASGGRNLPWAPARDGARPASLRLQLVLQLRQAVSGTVPGARTSSEGLVAYSGGSSLPSLVAIRIHRKLPNRLIAYASIVALSSYRGSCYDAVISA